MRHAESYTFGRRYITIHQAACGYWWAVYADHAQSGRGFARERRFHGWAFTLTGARARAQAATTWLYDWERKRRHGR